MNLDRSAAMRALRALFIAGSVMLAGCASNGSSPDVHGSVYVGVGYYNAWGWGPCCYYAGSPPVVVGPPPSRPDNPGAGAPRPEQPIAKPPSRPAPAPRPAARGGGGRRR
jgi:hypothetical protein